MHKIEDGPADKSYGIHVAKLAGMPTDLLKRAAQILSQLESQDEIKLTALNPTEAQAQKATAVDTAPSVESSAAPVNAVAEKTSPAPLVSEPDGQLELFAPAPAVKKSLAGPEEKVIRQLKNLNLMGMTPMEIMNQVYEWQTRLAKQK